VHDYSRDLRMAFEAACSTVGAVCVVRARATRPLSPGDGRVSENTGAASLAASPGIHDRRRAEIIAQTTEPAS
jgi:hypothetical protein